MPAAPGLVHYLLNKPAGRRHHGLGSRGPPDGGRSWCPTSPGSSRWAGSTWQTEGLLILTNDGELAQLLTHPSHGVPKEYLAEVEGVPSPGRARAGSAEGVELDDGPTAPATVGVVRPRACCGSSSTRAGTARSAGCARRWATRSAGWSVPGSGRSADRSLAPGHWRALTDGRGPGAGHGGRTAAVRSRRAGPSGSMHGRCPEHLTVRALRGATTVDADTAEQVTERVQELLIEVMARNGLVEDDIISIIFTATPDVVSMFPATAARGIGFGAVPLLCASRDPGAGRHAALRPGPAPRQHRPSPATSCATSTSTAPKGSAMTSPAEGGGGSRRDTTPGGPATGPGRRHRPDRRLARTGAAVPGLARHRIGS